MKEIIINLASQTGFATLDYKNYIMTPVSTNFIWYVSGKYVS